MNFTYLLTTKVSPHDTVSMPNNYLNQI